MKTAVFQKKDSDFCENIRKALPEAEIYPDGERGCSFDMILCQCGAPMVGSGIKGRILICDSRCDAGKLCGFGAGSVITVGLTGKDTLTHSSTLQRGGVASLQREVISLGGEIIRPQEVLLDGIEGDLTEKLAIKAALLLS